MTHEAGGIDTPQLCAKCGRIIVPHPRMPFPPGHAVLFEVDVGASPPMISRVVDTVQKVANIQWCTEVAERDLTAFPYP